MTVLPNPRHEAFAQALCKGKSADAAYQEAGYKANRHNAAAMAREEHIRTRVAELQEMVADRVVVDREWVVAKLVENVDRAMQAVEINKPDGTGTGEYKYDGSVANKALELLGKEIGMFVDRSENVNHNYEISDTPPSEEEWASEYAAKN